jgi:membrane-bound lytic murein transglycosylase B
MKIIKIILIISILSFSKSYADIDSEFENWKNKFKKLALANDISEKTFNQTIKNTKYLPNVIKYDRYQPEFYEDTKTYISKRTSSKKLKKGLDLYNKNKKLINEIENEFKVDKELMLALMGIETNFGTYVGKMDILSSLATLSFDKRRSQFFTKELITLLKLIENKKVDYKSLYGSWAGAFGFFQFMPSTIDNYAIDYNSNNKINLKNNIDAFASAANYLSKIGWDNSQPCFYKIKLKENIPNRFLNTSAQNIKNKKKLKYFLKYIDQRNFPNDLNLDEKVAIVTPDKDIVANADILSPAYIVFNNYEVILKWNRSLRFSLAVCTLKEKFKNEL